MQVRLVMFSILVPKHTSMHQSCLWGRGWAGSWGGGEGAQGGGHREGGH